MGSNATETNANRTATLLALGHVATGYPRQWLRGHQSAAQLAPRGHEIDEQHRAGHTTTPAAGDPRRPSSPTGQHCPPIPF